MQTSQSLRSAIKQDMRQRGYNFSVLSEKTGILRGSLSLIFVGGSSRRNPMPFQHLTKITEVLGLEEGTYFDLYVDECFLGGRPSRSRIEPFLKRCIELGHSGCLESVLDRLKGEARYLPLLFGIAEEYSKSSEPKPLIERLYEYLLIHHEDRHSIEKAICHYRLFLLRLGEDEENNSKELNAFTPYRDNLPDELKLEALTVMGSLYCSRMDAEELEKSADELISLCLRLFGTSRHLPHPPFRPEEPLSRPPIVFYGYGYILKQLALCEKNDFEAAAACSQDYEALDWLAGADDRSKQAAGKLTAFAYVNRLGCRLLGGETEVLTEYIGLLDLHPKEAFAGVIVVLKSANRFGFSVDEWLRQVPLDLQQNLELQDNPYHKQLVRNRYARLLVQLSIYHFNRGRTEESLRAALQSWELSHQLNNHRMFRLLASLTLMYSGQSEPPDH